MEPNTDPAKLPVGVSLIIIGGTPNGHTEMVLALGYDSLKAAREALNDGGA